MDSGKTNSSFSLKPRLFYGWYIVAASWMMAFLITGTSVGIFFKPLLDEFGWDRATLSMVSAIAMLVFAGFSPFLGRLIDRFGPRAMLLVGSVAQILSNVSNGLASGLVGIYIGRFLYELKPTHSTQVLINHWFVKNRGKALGILSTGVPLGTLLLSPFSQYLILVWGWRLTMFFWAGVTAVMVLPLLLLIRDKPEQKGLVPDGKYSDVQHLKKPSPSLHNTTPIKLPEHPGQSLAQAIKNRSLWLISATHLICGIGCGLIGTHTVIFATDLGYSAIIGASFLSVQGGVSLFGVLVTGHMSDRMARNLVLTMTHFIRSLSFVLLVVAIVFHGSLWVLYLAMALFGFGWFTTSPLVGGLVADLYGNLRMGTILGVLLACHIVGMSIGTYAGGISYQLTHSYFSIFLIQSILEFLAAVLAFSIIKKHHTS